MAFLVNYDEITSYGFGLNSKSSAWQQQLSDVFSSVSTFIQMASFKGEAAENVKHYLQEVHGTIILSLGEIFQEISTRFLLYKDGYYDIDSNHHAQLCEHTLRDLNRFFRESRDGFDLVEPEIKAAITSVMDLILDDPPIASALLVSEAYGETIYKLNFLDNQVQDYELDHNARDFVQLDQMISKLKQFIDQYLAMNNNSKGAYVAGSIAESLLFKELAETLQEAKTDRDALGKEFEIAKEREQKRIEALEEEWAKQRAEEGALQMLTATLAIVGGVACIVLTAGMATPLVVAGVVVGTATVAYGASEFIEGEQDLIYGLAGDYSTVAFNPMRDTIFMGNQQAYDVFGTACQISSTVLTLGAGGINAFGQGVVKGTAAGLCKEGISLAGKKAVLEFGTKALITAGAGTISGWGGKEIAKAAGASDAVAEMIGIGSGMLGGTVAGVGMSKWEWSYKGGSRGIPDGVCFVAGTPVSTALGMVAIEKIKAGDNVISTNPETGEIAEKEVLQTYIRKSDTLVHVWIDGENIQVTPNHLFYVSGKGWVAAADLKVSDQLRNAFGEVVLIQDIKVESLQGDVTVYNFEVADFHTYHVGDFGVLVHNADYAPRKPIQNVSNVDYDPTDGSTTYTKQINGRDVSVKYNSDGYPDFSPYAHPDYPDPVTIDYSGSRATDFSRANQKLNLGKTPKGYTWHHMEDGKSMMLVQEIVHGTKFGFPHTGGFSLNPIK